MLHCLCPCTWRVFRCGACGAGGPAALTLSVFTCQHTERPNQPSTGDCFYFSFHQWTAEEPDSSRCRHGSDPGGAERRAGFKSLPSSRLLTGRSERSRTELVFLSDTQVVLHRPDNTNDPTRVYTCLFFSFFSSSWGQFSGVFFPEGGELKAAHRVGTDRRSWSWKWRLWSRRSAARSEDSSRRSSQTWK